MNVNNWMKRMIYNRKVKKTTNKNHKILNKKKFKQKLKIKMKKSQAIEIFNFLKKN